MPDQPARSAAAARISAFFYAGAGIFRRQHGRERWWDFDGYDGFPPFLPVFVFEPLHVWDWHMRSTEAGWVSRTSIYAYRAIPLRWSRMLLLRTFMKVWLWPPMFTGLLFSISAAHAFIAKLAGLWLFGVCVAGLVWLWILNRRDQQIRLLLGRHRLGASDPIDWTDDLRALVAPASTWFRVATFEIACETLLAQQKYSEAMWAARLCAAIEDVAPGEELTRRILQDPGAQARLAELSPSAAPEAIRPWPMVLSKTGEDAEFWYRHLFEGETEMKVDVQYAQHVGGMMAAAFEPDDTAADEEFERNPPHIRTRRSGPSARQFLFGGIGIVAAAIMVTYLFVKVANLFRLLP